MSEPMTLQQALADFGESLRELNRVIAAQLTPSFEKLIVELRRIDRELYLARLRRWIPVWCCVLFVAIILGWWLT